MMKKDELQRPEQTDKEPAETRNLSMIQNWDKKNPKKPDTKDGLERATVKLQNH